jgi:hypothetical protein
MAINKLEAQVSKKEIKMERSHPSRSWPKGIN